MPWSVLYQDHTPCQCWNWKQDQDSRHQKRLRDSPPGIHDPTASPLIPSSKWNDAQTIAAGQINPVRAGSWEDEVHSRFKAPPSSPQVISCHNVPRERDKADSGWELCKANTADRRGPSWSFVPRCSSGDWGPPAHKQILLPIQDAVHTRKAGDGSS